MRRRRSLERPCGRLLALLAVLVVAVSSELRGVEPYNPVVSDPVLEGWRWRSFPELKGAGLRCIAESSDGAMWFGTDSGVRRYDGRAWQRFTTEDGLLSAPVNVLRAAAGGAVYAGSDMGISRFDRGTWHSVFPPTKGFSWPIDQILESSDGSLWAATAWGLLRLEGDGAILFTSSDMATAIQKHVDYVEISIVEDKVIPERSWGDGVGIRVAKGGYMGVSRGGLPMVAWAVAPGRARGAGWRSGGGDRYRYRRRRPAITPHRPGRCRGDLDESGSGPRRASTILPDLETRARFRNLSGLRRIRCYRGQPWEAVDRAFLGRRNSPAWSPPRPQARPPGSSTLRLTACIRGIDRN